MLTPVFQCSQEGGFVIVRICLSALCKVTDAAFDIHDTQFTFFCSPYYLRLRFDQHLQEDKGERATYDLEANVLTVYLPKADAAEVFERLDNPAYLIATEKQRASFITVLGGTDAAEAGGELEETEYVQSLADAGRGSEASTAELCSYGFANSFSGLFHRLDPDVAREVVHLPENPDHTSREERRRLRLEAETDDFDEDALLLSFEDTDGEVAHLLQYVPAHVDDFRAALQGSTTAASGVAGASSASAPVVFASIPSLTATAVRCTDDDALEEEETPLLGGDGGPPVTVWSGNVADFKRPLIEELEPTGTDGGVAAVEQDPPQRVADAAASCTPSPAPRTRLAIPRVRPSVSFTREETAVLMRLKLPRLLFPPAPAEVEALTAELLFCEAYDDLVTEGSGCSESLWNITKLSAALSYLDPAETLYDACVNFARRALVYPLHRHCAILQRVWAVVGTRLLLGRSYTVRALLRLRTILSHAEHKHLLSTIYLDPLLAYWLSVPDADVRLMRVALELHQHASRTEPTTASATSTSTSVLLATKTRTLYPLTLLYLHLPFSEPGGEEPREE
ncbi:SHQ1 protein [Novymonas esmeraldas]|uniref:SHQ1 protein n=1 Tax=Novymonas esmeraldas TaxID=1808958 RepID=A0AAW0EYB9_9TRYP